MNNDRESAVLARLPNGVWLASTLLPDQTPPHHVYRVVGADGVTLVEFATLIELLDNLHEFT
jgi:hypothetical protein